MPDPGGDGVALPGRQMLAPRFGLMPDEGAVEQGQGLGRDVGQVSLSPGAGGLGQTEGLQKRVVGISPNLLVDAAPPGSVQGAGRGDPFALAFSDFLIDGDGAAVQRRVQAAGDAQHGVADLFGFEPSQVGMLEETVGGVHPERLGGGPAAHAVSLGRGQPAHHALDGVALLNEAGGQLIQELRVCGRGAQLAEVVRGADDAVSEKVPPDAVDHHPGGKGIVG